MPKQKIISRNNKVVLEEERELKKERERQRLAWFLLSPERFNLKTGRNADPPGI